MSSPHYTAKTDPAEYARFQQEDRRANYISYVVLVAIVVVVLDVAYWIGVSVGIAIRQIASLIF